MVIPVILLAWLLWLLRGSRSCLTQLCRLLLVLGTVAFGPVRTLLVISETWTPVTVLLPLLLPVGLLLTLTLLLTL